MARMSFEQLNTELDACITDGVIYNVDFNNWKSYVAGRELESDIQDIRAEFTYAGKWEDRNERELAAIEALSYSVTQFPSKKLIKQLNTLDAQNSVAHSITNLINKWKPVADKFRELKPMIVKGRKPAVNPHQTSERTLENTGTCACCGKNVKLNDGKIVDHGFNIKWGVRNGQCFGVGYKPIEVSTEGAVAYRNSLETMVSHYTCKKHNLVKYNGVVVKHNNSRSGKIEDISFGEEG